MKRVTPHAFRGIVMITTQDVIDWIDAWAPFSTAAPWDNCGLQVGSPSAPVHRILVALDATSSTIAEAENHGCHCLVTHHPLIMEPLKSLRSGHHPDELVMRLIRSGIHLVAAHTNLDLARNGTNDILAGILGLTQTQPLEPPKNGGNDPSQGGMGRRGKLPRACSLVELARDLARQLNTSVRTVGNGKRKILTVALCTGSGMGMVEYALDPPCDVLITGDIKYHDAQAAKEKGLALIDIGHFPSEVIVVEPLALYLKEKATATGKSVEVLVAQSERDPFVTLGWTFREGGRFAGTAEIPGGAPNH